ncbi:MAG: hypothetical protein KC620_09850 [Myxococcales bacterium]|nr:hypothetical protein [Myxococcales bacterium]
MSNANPVEAKPADAGARRLGTFGGVFTPSILTILGVIMYLRFGWVVGNAGLGGALIIVVISHVISLTTGLSVSSIATNRTVGAGGAYYMISRSLGAPAGAAVGIPLFFAQALSVTFYVVGFTESLGYLLPKTLGHPLLDLLLDPRVLGTATCLMLCAVALRSAEAAIKLQYVVMAAIGLSLIAFFGGRAAEPPTEITWFNRDGAPFSQVFAVFFPAVTGIMAGVSMSGDLKDARRSLPRGTLFAILTGFVIYSAFPIWLAFNADSQTLMTNNRVVFEMSLLPALIFLGVWGATLSSAVGSILAAPRTLQALAIDGLAPRLFARGYGPTNEPRVGLMFTFMLAEVGVLLGSLDVIAPILTMFFLATYGITNLACGLERWAANPSFRPTFRVSALISIGGAVACFYVMSIIDLGAMIASSVICGLIYIYVERRALNTTFGDARHGLWSALVRTALRNLHRAEYHDQNWRPNLLIFGGPPHRRRYLLDLGAALVQERGIVSYIQMLEGEVSDLADERATATEHLDALREDYPTVFVRVDIVPQVYRGAVIVAQSYGIGSLEANTVMLGWVGKRKRASEYFAMLSDLAALRNALVLVHHDPNRGFGNRKRIHIWWRGLQANGGLMLLIAYLLTSHDRFRQAEVTTLTVIESEDDRERAEAGLRRVFESARLQSKARVLLREGRSIQAIMRHESGEADLAVLGLRLPAEGEDPEALFEHYQNLLAQLPTAMLVHSGRAFDAAPVLFDDE